MADDKFLIRLGADVTTLQGDLQKANNTLTGWASKLKSIGGLTVAGFGTGLIAESVFEMSKLAGQAEGVEAAFRRLPAATQVMMEMKAATHGTVSELELMKRTVQAANFGISLEALPKLLEFATLRAQQTGQSVDYLVDSIVTGIGRKSPLILDNLGISATALKEKLNGVSIAEAEVGTVADAVGAIASDALKNMAGFSDNASSKVERLGASWENMKVSIGEAANGTGVLGSLMDTLSGTMDVLASKNISWTEKILAFTNAGGLALAMTKDLAMNTAKAAEEQAKHTSIVRQADQAIETFGFNLDAIKKAYQQNINVSGILEEIQRRMNEKQKTAAPIIENIAYLTEKLKAAQEQQTTATGNSLIATNLEIKSLEEKIKKLKELGTVSALKQITPPPGSPISQIKTQELNLGFQAKPYEMQFDMGKAVGPLQQYVAGLKEMNNQLTQTINIAPLLSSGIAEIAEGFGTAMVTGAGFGQTIVRAISGFMKSFGQQLIAIGIGKMALDKLFKSPAGGIAAIVAGTALVAASAAMNAAAAKGISSLSSGGSGSYGGSGYDSRASVNTNTQNLTVTGEFRMRGSDLVATVRNAQQDNNILKGS